MAIAVFLYNVWTSDLFQRTAFPREYWIQRVNSLTECVAFHKRMISGLGAIDFALDQQRQDLLFHRQKLAECSVKLAEAHGKLARYE